MQSAVAHGHGLHVINRLLLAEAAAQPEHQSRNQSADGGDEQPLPSVQCGEDGDLVARAAGQQPLEAESGEAEADGGEGAQQAGGNGPPKQGLAVAQAQP